MLDVCTRVTLSSYSMVPYCPAVLFVAVILWEYGQSDDDDCGEVEREFS